MRYINLQFTHLPKLPTYLRGRIYGTDKHTGKTCNAAYQDGRTINKKDVSHNIKMRLKNCKLRIIQWLTVEIYCTKCELKLVPRNATTAETVKAITTDNNTW